MTLVQISGGHVTLPPLGPCNDSPSKPFNAAQHSKLCNGKQSFRLMCVTYIGWLTFDLVSATGMEF